MFCKKCGNSLDSKSVYCDRCGAAVNGAVEKAPSSLPVGSIVAIALAVVYLFLLFAPWVSMTGDVMLVIDGIRWVREQYEEDAEALAEIAEEIGVDVRSINRVCGYLMDGKISPYEASRMAGVCIKLAVKAKDDMEDYGMKIIAASAGFLTLYYASILLSLASIYLFLKGKRNWVQLVWAALEAAKIIFFLLMAGTVLDDAFGITCKITYFIILSPVCLAGTFFCRLRPILPGQNERQGSCFTSY